MKTITARFHHGRTLSKRRSLYDVLDVSHSATQAEIKAAHYELSLKYHPDVNNSEEAQHNYYVHRFVNIQNIFIVDM